MPGRGPVASARPSPDNEPVTTAADTTTLRRSQGPATAALLVATAIWGSTFIVTKNTLDSLHPDSLLTWRFGIAAAVLGLVGWRHARALTRRERRHGTLLGLFLAAGFLLQTHGLEHTLASLSGFLLGLSILLTPLAAALFFRERVGGRGWAAVLVGLVGLALLTGGAPTGTVLGITLTIGGAVAITGHITGLSQWATPANALGLTAWSVIVAAATCAVAAAATGGIAAPPGTSAWLSLGYLALAATCLGFAVQAWAQSSLTATSAAIIMTMEPVFAAALAALFGEQRLPPLAWTGGLLVVASMLLAELGPRQCCDALAPRIECC
jgi:drug/metabolite transporter (DMT)-like permease